MYSLAFRNLLAVSLQTSTNVSSLKIARTIIGQYSYLSEAKIPRVKARGDKISTELMKEKKKKKPPRQNKSPNIASNDKREKEAEPVNQLKDHSK